MIGAVKFQWQGSLVASYLRKMSMFRKWPCPWMSITNQREGDRAGRVATWGRVGVQEGPSPVKLVGGSR
jgi:hypothetical protein